MRFELHCHSTCSDGTESPDQVVARAAERGVEVFALTDHDTCAGSGVTAANVRTIRAVELSCDYQGKTIHVLAFDRGGAWDALAGKLAGVRAARVNRLRMMAAKLVQRGITVDLAPLLADAEHRTIGRPDLARAMVAMGVATSFKDAFARHLYDGGPVDVPHHALPIEDALVAGREAGAAMALAHPHLYDDRSAHLLRKFKDAGLTGIEAFYGQYDVHQRARWTKLADSIGLVCTGGSDWHGPEDAQAQPGVDFTPERTDALLAWLG